MLKLPSLQGVLKETGATLKRFPLPVLVSIIAASVAIYITHYSVYEERENTEELIKVVMCCALGLNIFIASQLFSESKKHSLLQTLIIKALAISLLLIYYFTLPDFKDFALKDGVRYALFNIGLHLLVSFSPFIGNGTINDFWQFNKSLFIRFLTACLYTGVLYIGLALALLAIDKLFKVQVDGDLYADLWWIMAGVFNTIFFLAGVPKPTETLDAESSYPKGLKIFTQFVLLPLVAIYLLILYAYGTKIAIVMELPKGWVSYLVIGFSVAGILSLLLIWPIRNEEGNSWIKIADRWFYRALYPLIILLGLAIFKRVSEYGITENRYFILLIAIWLAATATYFLFSKTKNIKVIPVSLCIMAFLSSFGPWGVFSVSERSQVNRLEKLLIEENILVNGKIKKSDTLVKNKNSQSITSLIDYLDKNHGFDAIKPWFVPKLDSLFVAENVHSRYGQRRTIVMDLLGVQNYYSYSYQENKSFYILSESENTPEAFTVTGFDYYQNLNQYFQTSRNDVYYNPVKFGNNTLLIKYFNNELIFYVNDKIVKSVDFIGYVKGLQKQARHQYQQYMVTKELLVFPVDTDSLFIQLNFSSISGEMEENDSLNINGINAHVLIKLK